MSKLFDLVLFGASGFTGEYVLEEFVKSEYYQKYSFAIAGRSQPRLEKTLEKVGKLIDQDLSKIPILIADSSSPEQLQAVAEKARVVISVVGPYALHGEAIVKACVEGKASYVDISGEPAFLEKVQLKYGEKARQNGVYIVGSCGFESIPCDLGVQFLKKNFPGTLAYVETVGQLNAGPHGYTVNDGSYQTLLLALENGKVDNLEGIRKELMPEKLNRTQFKPPKRSLVWQDKKIGRPVILFPGTDKSVVDRTQYYDATKKQRYPVSIETYFSVQNVLWAYLIIVWFAILNILTKFSVTRRVIRNYPSLASFGAFAKNGGTREQVKSSTFSYFIHGTGWAESEPQPDKTPTKTATVRVDGPDCGYIGTAGCLIAAAITLLEDQGELPENGGVFTPGAAFEETKIISRLERFNVTFKIVD
ncbi:unnamed protein product [Bursaphelenchus xylophilus]|nr:unnamed protein product [Bursaphelenchus xylophilus]CAG9109865.1 unnamed protein product [Bursaphelenchus xylophilus]